MKSFDRGFLEKLFEIAKPYETRELGREAQFIEKCLQWKLKENEKPMSSNNTSKQSDSNYVSIVADLQKY